MIAGLVLLAGGAAVGLFGSLLGLGGGILLVPLLTLGFGRPLREAVAISLVSVIVTSSAGAGCLPAQARREPAPRAWSSSCSPRAARSPAASSRSPCPSRCSRACSRCCSFYVAISMLRRREPAPAPPAAGEEPVPVAEELRP